MKKAKSKKALSNVWDLVVRQLRQTSKRRYIEVGTVLVSLLAIMWIATLITPYQPDDKYDIYSPEQRSSASTTYFRAKVNAIGASNLDVTLLDGPQKNTNETVYYPATSRLDSVRVGSTILVANTSSTDTIYLIDTYRIPVLITIIALFMALVVIVGSKRGIMSLVGLGVSMVVVVWFIIPFILAGHNSLLVCIAGAYIIAFSTIIIAHGVKLRTIISLGCVVFILLIVAILAHVAVTMLGLQGSSDETSYYLMLDMPQIDMAGVLAGGIIIASLGVLDDIVTAQVATVDELQKANAKLGIRQLFRRASSVGAEHIASLVNTLVLVYVGAALPILISLFGRGTGSNAVLVANGEYISAEIVRTVIASSGLVMAVPISTLVAAFIFYRIRKNNKPM